MKFKKYEGDPILGGCQVVKSGDGYLMMYIDYRDIDTACICAAWSQDGIKGWKRCKDNPLVTPDVGMWDEDSCYKPSFIIENGKVTVWYNGRKGTNEYIGAAISDTDKFEWK